MDSAEAIELLHANMARRELMTTDALLDEMNENPGSVEWGFALGELERRWAREHSTDLLGDTIRAWALEDE